MATEKLLRLGTDGLEEVVVSTGSATVKEVEIDLGASAIKDKKFTITDAEVSTDSLILIGHSAKAATGRQQDENEMDALFCRAAPGTGEFTLYVTVLTGRASGKYRINYLLG